MNGVVRHCRKISTGLSASARSVREDRQISSAAQVRRIDGFRAQIGLLARPRLLRDAARTSAARRPDAPIRFFVSCGLEARGAACNSANGAVAGHLGPLGPAYRNATAIGCAATIASNLTAPAIRTLRRRRTAAPSRQASAQSLSDRAQAAALDRSPPRSAPRAPLPGPGRASQGGRSPVIKKGASVGARTSLTTIDAIRDDFAFLDDWEDRYRYVIELGRALEPLRRGAQRRQQGSRLRQPGLDRGETRTDADGGQFCIFAATAIPIWFAA